MSDQAKIIANQEAEEMVLAACLADHDALLQAVDLLRPEMFNWDRHRLTFGAMCEMLAAGQEVDLVTVADTLDNQGYLQRVGGATWLAGLMSLSITANVAPYAPIIREKYQRRQMIAAARKIAYLATDEDGDFESQAAEAEQLVMGATQGISAALEKWGTAIWNRWDALYQSRNDKDVTGLKTNFYDLDASLGGLQPGDLIILAARPSQGKTTLAQNIMERVAKQGKTVYFASLEMSKTALADRAISANVGIDGALLRARALPESEWERGSHEVLKITNLPIWLDDDGLASSLEIRSRARRIKSEHGLSLVAVDFLQLVNDRAEKGQTRNELVGAITKRMKAMAKELDVPVLLLSQLNRSVEQRDSNKPPQLSDLRDSGEIEQVADVVLFIHMPDKQFPQNREIIIAKHRNGPIGKVRLEFDRQFVRFKGAKVGWNAGSVAYPQASE